MFIQTPPLPFWSVWAYLSLWEKLFLLVLCILGIYALFSAVIDVSRIRKTKQAIQRGNSPDIESTLSGLRRRSLRLQRLIETAFCGFGLVLFLNLQRAHLTLDNSKIPVGLEVLQNFQVDFVFAFNAFFGFLSLHVLTWFVSTWVERFGLQSKRKNSHA
jgi:hypothetical protein